MDLSELIPDEIWIHILYFTSFRDILILRLVNKRLKDCAFTSLSSIQEKLKLLPCHNMVIPNYEIRGKNPWTYACDNLGKKITWINIIWTSKKDILTEVVSDMLPRDGNRALAYNGIEWVWIRGPFKSTNKEKTKFDTSIIISQHETIYGLCRYLKDYEVEMLDQLINNTCINTFIYKSDDTKTLHWISPYKKHPEQPKNYSSLQTIVDFLSKIKFNWN